MTDDSNTDAKAGRHEGDVAFIQALADLLNRNELTELEVAREYGEDDSLTVRVVKQAPQMVTHSVSAQPPAATPALSSAPAPVAAAAPEAGGDPAALPGAVAKLTAAADTIRTLCGTS